jgi:hypothetical protein
MPLPANLPEQFTIRPSALLRWALLAVSLAGAISLSCATLARADTSASEEITFQEGLVADDGALNNQYEAGYGVEFDTPTPGGDSLGFPGSLPMTECGAQLLTDGFYKPGSPPVVILASRSGGDEGCKSSSEFYGPDQGMLFHIDDARASLSLQMHAFPQQSNQLSAIVGAVAVAYRADGTVLDEVRLDAAEAREWTTVSLSTADPNGIQFVAVYGEIDIGAAVGVQIDNLKLPEALKTSQPAFRVTESLQGDSGDLVEGDTLDIPIQIVRENGSTGTVTVNALASEGSALSRVAVNQSPSGEPTGTALLELTAGRGQAGQSVTVTVSGTGNSEGGTQDGPSLSFTFTVEQDLVLVTSGSAAVAQSCQDPSGLELQVAGTTPMTVAFQSSDGYEQEIAVAGRGQYPIPHSLTAAYAGSASSEHISLSASEVRTNNFLPAFASASLGVTLERPVPRMSLNGGFYTTPNQARVFPSAVTQISLQASGLPCHELALAVGDDGAQTSSFRPTATGTASVSMPVPAAASAPLSSRETVPVSVIDKSAGEAVVGSVPVYLADFRADDGFHFINAALTSLQWSDIERTFGPDVNDCTAFFCWHDPIAEGYFKSMQGGEPNGLCFGYTMLASSFYRGEVAPTLFGSQSVGTLAVPTRGVTSVGELPNYPVINDETALGQALVSGWLSQFDTRFQDSEHDGVGGYASVSAFAGALSGALARDGIAIVDLQGPEGQGGHSVLAYGIAQTGAGRYAISVYNPNVAYGDQERLAATPTQFLWANEISGEAAHLAGLEQSQLLLGPSGSTNSEWQLTGAPNWSGTVEKLGITTMAQRPLKPQLLSLNTLGNAAQVVLSSASTAGAGASAPAAAISQITAGGKSLLDSHGVPLKGSSVRLDLPADAGPPDTSGTYVLPVGKTYSVTTSTLHAGAFGMLALSGGGGAGIENATAAPGASDSLTLRPGSPTIAFSGASSSPVTLELVGSAAGAGRRTATLTLSSGKGLTSASLSSAGAIVVRHSGARANLSVQLFSRGVAVGTSTIALGGGATVSFTPRWAALPGSVSATVGGRHTRLSLSRGRGGALSQLFAVTPRHKARKPKRKHRKR